MVGLYLQDSQVDLYLSKEGSQLKAGNDPQWGLNILPLTKDWWVMKVWRSLPGSHLIHQMWFPLVKHGRILILSQTQDQSLNSVERCCCVSQIVWVFGLPA